MQLFYSSQAALHAPCTLDADESRHAVRVLRLREGDSLHLTNGRGSIFRCQIVEANDRACTVVADAEVQSPCPHPRLTLAVAPTKNPSRMEWLVEKAVEVGVATVQLLQCDHSERTFLKTDRLQKLAVSAMKQSLHAELPAVLAAEGMTQWLAAHRPSWGDTQCFIAHCDAQQPRLALSTALQDGRDAVVLIGPEGDFSAAEIQQALDCGFRPVSLGPSRLRTETAALYAAVAFNLANDR